MFGFRQLFPDNIMLLVQLRHVVGAFLHVRHGGVQGRHITGPYPELANP